MSGSSMRVAGLLATIGVLAASGAHAQEKYPAKVIRIVTAAPGSNHDWGARLVANELAPRVGQRVIVENRGSIATEYVAKEAPADGYTLLFYGSYTWLQPLLQKVNWDPLADLAPITIAITSPNLLVVHPSLPVKSVKELISLASARPGQLNYAAGGGGSTPHIAAELFKYMAHVNITRVNYKGSGPSMIGLLVGETQLMFAALGPVMPHVKAAKVRALAVTTPRRSRLTPDLPTVADTIPGYASEAVIGLFAPRKTAPAIINLINREAVQALRATDPQKVFNAGVEIVANSPEEFASFIKSEMTRMGEVIRSASFSS